MNWNFLMGPILGAVIGYITNGIAIKMLFRPLKPIKIGNYTLPFTPGVIPKEKERIARSIGKVISKELLNEEAFREALLKEEIYEQIENKIDDLIDTYKTEEKILEQLGEEILGRERRIFLTCELEEKATYLIYNKVVELGLGKIVVEKLVNALKEGGLGSFLGPMSFLVNGNMIDSLGEKVEPIISQMIVDEAEGLIRKAVEEESEKLQSSSIGEWIAQVEVQKDIVKKLTVRAYESFINHNLATTLQKLNLAQIIEARIMDFEALELEKIILQLMHKELNMIIWLGALLGGVMGCVMSFF